MAVQRPAQGGFRSDQAGDGALTFAIIVGVVVVTGVVIGVLWLLQDDDPTEPEYPTSDVNLVSADAFACPFNWNHRDLRIEVRLDGEPVLEVRASAHKDPTFAVVAHARPGPDSVLTVHAWSMSRFTLEERPCDLGEGSPDYASIPWNGTEGRHQVVGPEAEVLLVLGDAPEPAGNVRTVVAAEAVTLHWDPPADAESMHVARGRHGAIIWDGPGDATHATVTGICDGTPYTVRVLARQGDFLVGQPVNFTSPNVAPAPPLILSADRTGERVDVEWEDSTRHDAAHYHVYAGPAGFTPSLETRVASEVASDAATQRASIRVADGDVHVRVEVVDEGGLRTMSPAFLIDGPHVQPTRDVACRDDPLDPAQDHDVPLPVMLCLVALVAVALAGRRWGPR